MTLQSFGVWPQPEADECGACGARIDDYCHLDVDDCVAWLCHACSGSGVAYAKWLPVAIERVRAKRASAGAGEAQ